MSKRVKYHEMFNEYGWPVFSSSQTENRLALCKRALCETRRLTIKIKDCYRSELEAQKYCKLRFVSENYFSENAAGINELAWGGMYQTLRNGLEGGFYPFVRCIERNRPVDSGIIWLGTRHEYPRIYVDNLVANWLCPYSKSGSVLTEPFAPLPRVVEIWARLADRRLYPGLDLPPVPDL
jgi:hypothetical protein